MSKIFAVECSVLAILLVSLQSADAQVSAGTIAGTVVDSSGGSIDGLRLDVAKLDTALTREATTDGVGRFEVPALLPGDYRILAEMTGFKRLERFVTVEAGTTTVVDMIMEPGELTETISVSGTATSLRGDHHQVAGVVTRDQIERLPLNGRDFLELAKLEPGATSPQRGTNNRTFVATLGAGLQSTPRIGYTRVTLDGASIGLLGGIGAALHLSQDAVQEFQISTVNFDPATGVTSNGAVNIVTRSGANDYHGSAFAFYRDHHLSAYPGITRNVANPDPFFRRAQFGLFAGGPLRHDKAFFFASYEGTDQNGVVSVQPRDPALADLRGIFSSPFTGNQISARVDARLGSRHDLLFRHTYDGNRTFAPLNDRTDILPSGWSRTRNRVKQTLAALSSVFSPALVNDVRGSIFFLDTPEGPGTYRDCPGCFGLGAAPTVVADAGVTLGNPRTVSLAGRRTEVSDILTLERGGHDLRVGFDWEHSHSTGSALNQEPAQLTLWSPSRVRQVDPTMLLPESFTTVEQMLQLPLMSVSTSVGPSDVLQRGFHPYRLVDLYRAFGSDTWHVTSRLTVNAGVGWSYEPNALNSDLTKPALLTPILHASGLVPSAPRRTNFSPSLGFAWASDDRRTVVRGGAGRYFDPAGSANAVSLANERSELSPLGTGRIIVSGSNISWNGSPLSFRQPTGFTGADLLAALPAIRSSLLSALNPANRDFSLRNIDRTKEGTNLSDPFFSLPYAVHLGIGIERQVGRTLTLSADLVWRHFVHTFVTDIDYNRWFSAAGSVIQRCRDAQRDDPAAQCSNGPITFDATIGRARYKGLLVRADTRLSGRSRLAVSYALSSYVGTNGAGGPGALGGSGFNNDNWFENYGPLPTDRRHVLNVSGFAELGWNFQAGFNVSAYSRPPFSPYVGGIDFNGDGTSGDLLPGTTVNQFNRGLNKNDLRRLVDDYNRKFAGRITPVGQIAPFLTLPNDFGFNDSFFAADVRLSREFRTGVSARLVLVAEVFNLFNTANLINYSADLTNTASFGRPSARFDQIFGSGGPRSAQLGVRMNF